MASCINVDDIHEESVSLPITYEVGGVETKATLVKTENLAEQFPTMDVVALTYTGTEVFRQTLDIKTCNTSDTRYWTPGRNLAFFSYPKGELEPEFGFDDGGLYSSFHYKVAADAITTPDLVMACTGSSVGAKVKFSYKHLFTAICVRYKDMKSAHTIKKVEIENAYTEGDCTMHESVKYPLWSNQSSPATLSDTNSKKVYYGGQLITEDGFIFMIVPNDQASITVKVWIDNETEPLVFEPFSLKSNYGGQMFTFDIEDVDKSSSGSDMKAVVKNPDGTYSITIDAYVTGEVVTTTKTMPTNTVFVLDASGSMADNLTDTPLAKRTIEHAKYVNTGFDKLDKVKGAEVGYYAAYISIFGALRDIKYDSGKWKFYNETRKRWDDLEDGLWTAKVYRRKLEMMKSVCKDYVEAIAATNDEHYISVVSFSADSHILCSKVDVRSGKQAIINAINSISAAGGTYTDLGMHNARTLLMNPANYYNAMVVITDGEPGLTTFNERVANDAIGKACDCKNVYSAYVYSIGVFGNEVTSNCKAFLDRLSSNYKDATTYKNGTKTSSSYYSIATSEEAITTVMKSIQKEVQTGGASVKLGSDSYLIDIISGVFEVPQYGQVVIKQADWISDKNFGSEYGVDSSVQWTLDGTKDKGYTLKVIGFDYSKHFCGHGATDGRKLVVHINNLILKSDAPTGSYTNENGSGLYNGSGVLVTEFNYPTI